MSGFLRGWLRDEPLATCANFANACGALAVSRHGCAPAYPSFTELRHLLENGSTEFALRKDQALENLHWSTTRHRRYDRLTAFAFDHRQQFIKWAEGIKVPLKLSNLWRCRLRAIFWGVARVLAFWLMTSWAAQRSMPLRMMICGLADQLSSRVCSRWHCVRNRTLARGLLNGQ